MGKWGILCTWPAVVCVDEVLGVVGAVFCG